MFKTPFDWPTAVYRRRGAKTRMRGILVLFDFDWKQRFGHDRGHFPGSESIADKAIEWTTKGKEPALFLTELPGHESPEKRDDTRYSFTIFSVDAVQSTHADLASSVVGKAATPDVLAALLKLKGSPDALHKLILDELTIDQIAKWAALDPQRSKALLEIATAVENLNADSAVPLLLDLLAGLASDFLAVQQFSTGAERPTLKLAAAAAAYARQRIAIDDFSERIQRLESEQNLQKFLEEHHWMFGTRYVGRWPGRQITVGNQQDFIMKSADGFFDLIELKRPGHSVLSWDKSHQNWYPSTELSMALGQVQKYLEDMDHELPAIEKRHSIQVHRAEAVIVIGDFSKATDPMRTALRGLNAHLSRIKVRTYDEVLAMARAIHGHTQTVIASASINTHESTEDEGRVDTVDE